MKILALMAQKGGCGKSTLARNLAVAALLDGKRAVIIDADPQQTCVKWRSRRSEEAPTVVALEGQPLKELMAQIAAANMNRVSMSGFLIKPSGVITVAGRGSAGAAAVFAAAKGGSGGGGARRISVEP